jgi:Uma2 family endonuclease
MSTATDELIALDEAAVSRLDGRFEYLNGRYVEKPHMGSQANELGLLLMSQLLTFVRANRLGRCFAENCTYRIFPNEPKRTRIPDGSFIRAGRLPGDKSPEGDMTIPPDLAIEVISPSNTVLEMEERIDDLLGAGVRTLWVVLPRTKSMYIYRADGSVSRLRATDVLSGEDVVPGFSCRLADLFDAI